MRIRRLTDDEKVEYLARRCAETGFVTNIKAMAPEFIAWSGDRVGYGDHWREAYENIPGNSIVT